MCSTVALLSQLASMNGSLQAYSKAADVFSFGVILWELITWQMPWEELGVFQVHSDLHLNLSICLLPRTLSCMFLHYLISHKDRAVHALYCTEVRWHQAQKPERFQLGLQEADRLQMHAIRMTQAFNFCHSIGDILCR